MFITYEMENSMYLLKLLLVKLVDVRSLRHMTSFIYILLPTIWKIFTKIVRGEDEALEENILTLNSC